MTDTTRLSRLNSPSPLQPRSTKAVPLPIASPSIPANLPTDSEEAVTLFLKYYESFVEAPVENPLVWQSQSFSGEPGLRSSWMSPWMALGILGVGGASVLVAANAVWSRNEAPSSPAGAQKSPFRQNPRAATPLTPSSAAPEAGGAAEFSPPPTHFNQVQIRRIVSPSLRSPLPGQVIRQQTTAVSAPVQPALKRAQPVKPIAAKVAVKTDTARQPTARVDTDLQPAAKVDADLQPATKADADLQPAAKVDADLQPAAKVDADLQPATKADPAPSAPAVTTPMPPQVAPGQEGQSSSNSPTAVLPILANAVRDRVTSTLPVPTALPAPQVFSKPLAEPLKQSISKAQTLQDFVQLSPQIPQDMQVAVLSLTPEAASAVPKAEEFETFQIYRFPQATYQKAWALLTQSSEAEKTLPAHGFIDYQQRAIVLVSL